MTEISSVGGNNAAYNYRVDRDAWVDRSVAAQEAAYQAGNSVKPMTADEMNSLLDHADVDRLKSTTTKGAGSGDAQLIGVLSVDKNGRYTKLSGEAAALYLLSNPSRPEGPKSAHNMQSLGVYTALNVDFVLQNIGKTGSKNIADYAEGVRRETEKMGQDYENVLFTGANGKGHVTHDVNEYIGWLSEAAMKRAGIAAQAIASANVGATTG